MNSAKPKFFLPSVVFLSFEHFLFIIQCELSTCRDPSALSALWPSIGLVECPIVQMLGQSALDADGFRQDDKSWDFWCSNIGGQDFDCFSKVVKFVTSDIK